jgi:cholesterol transport system auxiliary component
MSKSPLPVFNRREIVLLAGAGLLSGCGSIQLLPSPMQPQLYVLRPQVTLPMGGPVKWRLAVAPPDAPASLDTTRIALSRAPTTMDYFANAAWNDRAPLLLQRLLIQTFDASNRIVSVDRDTAGLETDYLLQTEIRDFEAHYETTDGAPEVIVSIQAKLARMPQREIVASLNVTQQAQAAANNLDSIVPAFNQATAAAIAQIAAWTLNAPPPPAAPVTLPG